jgi:cysteine desulfurase
VFTSGGTEADNLAIQGVAFSSLEKGNHIITSSIEHHAVLHTCQFLEGQGFKVTYLPVDREGKVSVEDVKKAITKQTVLVSIMTANNEIGTIEPIREIGAIARGAGAIFHTDAVQAITKMPIDLERDNIDLLALSAHKFHGPKGVGVLYVKKGVRLRPMIYGGGHERGMRSSTENVAGLVGMGKAIELGMAEMDESVLRMAAIRDRIIDGVLGTMSDTFLNGPRLGRLCNNAHFRFDFIEGESLILKLDAEGFAGSTGSACSTKSLDPSHVLMAIGLRPEQAHGSLRISLSKMNTMAEAEAFLKVVPGIVTKLREMSPIKSWKDYEGFNDKVCEH